MTRLDFNEPYLKTDPFKGNNKAIKLWHHHCNFLIQRRKVFKLQCPKPLRKNLQFSRNVCYLFTILTSPSKYWPFNEVFIWFFESFSSDFSKFQGYPNFQNNTKINKLSAKNSWKCVQSYAKDFLSPEKSQIVRSFWPNLPSRVVPDHRKEIFE